MKYLLINCNTLSLVYLFHLGGPLASSLAQAAEPISEDFRFYGFFVVALSTPGTDFRAVPAVFRSWAQSWL
jgi:hypothetical protein